MFAIMMWASYALVKRADRELESESERAYARDKYTIASNYID